MEDIQRKSINQSVLQRHDPAVTDIIDTASYVVVYNYDLDKQSWAKRGIEGSLFLTRRSTAPFFSFMILNRLSLDTFTFGLFPSMEYQTMENYLIYKTPEGLVQGLWMFSLDDRDRFVQLLGELCPISENPHDDAVVPDGNQDSQAVMSIMDLFARAQADAGPLSTGTTPYTLNSLIDVFNYTDGVYHGTASRSLSFDEFYARFNQLLQSPSFQSALYASYKNY